MKWSRSDLAPHRRNNDIESVLYQRDSENLKYTFMLNN